MLIAWRIAFTSIYEKISLPQFLKETLPRSDWNGREGPPGPDRIGGVQTWGKLRLGHPRARCGRDKKRL
jgi:hypothetical protein